MRYIKDGIVLVIATSAAALCRADSFAYIDLWATGTLTTGEDFESWRIHVVVPDGDDWVGSAIDGWLTSGPTWYYDPAAGFIARPDLFDVYPDAEFGTYFTVPEFYPNSDLWGGFGMSADGVFEPTYLHLGAWGGALVGSGDYVVFQGTVVNPIPDIYGTIEFAYDTLLEPPQYYTFVIPEPATGALLALCACCLLRRRSGMHT